MQVRRLRKHAQEKLGFGNSQSMRVPVKYKIWRNGRVQTLVGRTRRFTIPAWPLGWRNK